MFSPQLGSGLHNIGALLQFQCFDNVLDSIIYVVHTVQHAIYNTDSCNRCKQGKMQCKHMCNTRAMKVLHKCKACDCMLIQPHQAGSKVQMQGQAQVQTQV